METIKKKIRSSRSNISENSLNVYLSNIRKVFKEVFKNDVDMKYLNQFAKVKKYLDTLTPASLAKFVEDESPSSKGQYSKYLCLFFISSFLNLILIDFFSKSQFSGLSPL